MPITIQNLRTQAVTRSLFAPTTLDAAVAQLGFVQADPLRAPARAQDLILRPRVEGYRAGDLERHYPHLQLEENHLHVYGFLPTDALHLLHPRPHEWGIEQAHPGLAERVLAYVIANGETHHRHLEAEFGRTQTRSDWGGQAIVTTRILELLHYRGLLRVARRVGNTRTYVATAPHESLLEPDERLCQLVLLLVRLYAPVTQATLRDLVSRLRYAAPTLEGRRTVVARLLKSGALEQATIDGMVYLWPAGEWVEAEAPRSVRWLAPFDPVVWDRRRFEQLWDWPYRFEAYTPAAKRRWGYYALPMLWGDQVIGWANVTQKEGQLHADLGFVNSRPTEKEFEIALEEEFARMQSFLSR